MATAARALQPRILHAVSEMYRLRNDNILVQENECDNEADGRDEKSGEHPEPLGHGVRIASTHKLSAEI